MKRSRIVATIGVAGLVAVSFVGIQSPATAQDSMVVLANDFEDGTTQGWFGRGSAEVEVSEEQSHDGEASLLVSNRADTWQGPGRDLLDVLVPGGTYEIEAYVRLADPEAEATDLHLTVQRTPTGEDTAYERVASDVTATGDDWAQVAGSYSFSSTNNDELQLYIESPDPEASFYLDDVTITATELPSEVLVATDFEDGTTQGWGPRGDDVSATATEDDAFAGDWSLLTTGRTDGWHGPSIEISDYVEAGTTYGLSFHLKLAPGEEPTEMFLSVQAGEGDDATFTRLASGTVTADEWMEFSTTWTPTGDAEAFHVYAETGSADDIADFYLDEFVLSGLAPPEIEDIPPLQDVLADNFPIGVAIDERETAGASAELLNKHFNSITAENDMKPEEIQPVEGEFTFEDADRLVDFARENDLRVYGHVMVWHSQTPEWFFEDENGDPLSGDNPEHRQLLLDRMEAHIAALADRYRDDIWAWDVVNEAIDESQEDGLRRSPWYNILGPEYLDHAYHFAREHLGPDVKLYLNDFNTEFPAKREAMFNVVSGMLDRGVPIDGVGHQLHLNLVRPISWVDDSIERFRELPVEQAVTELDVSISQSTNESLPVAPPERLVQQGYYFRDLFEVLRSHDDVLAQVTAWGLQDGRSWLRTWPTDRPHEAPLFFDDRLQSKPAYWGVVDPEGLPHFPRTLNIPAGTAEVDGEKELLWDLLPGVELGVGTGTSFQARWDSDNLYLLVEVADDTVDAGDRVELYVDDSNAKAGDYQEGDAHYTVGRDGSVDGDATAEVTDTDSGYQVEAALPLLTPGEQSRQVGFDIRITDADTGSQISWSDQDHAQDTDTSRWGTLSLIEEISHVDVPYATTTPTVDGDIDEIWETAASIRTDVLIEGSADGAKADMRLLWDEERLYVLAEVADPQLDATSSDPWNQDSVEIFVDPGNTKSGAFTSDDGQYRINFENNQTINGFVEVIGENLTSATAVVDGGYIVEASIELTPAMEPEAGSFIGFEAQVNDGTDGARTAVHTWHDPTGQSYQDTSRWGVARFVDADVVEPTCDSEVTGKHFGPLNVSGGQTVCLTEDAKVFGPVTVHSGGSLIADGAKVTGPVSAIGADTVILRDTKVIGPVFISGVTGTVELSGNQVTGPVAILLNQTESASVVAGNSITGPLFCSGNDPAPTDEGNPNTVRGPKAGQCKKL